MLTTRQVKNLGCGSSTPNSKVGFFRFPFFLTPVSVAFEKERWEARLHELDVSEALLATDSSRNQNKNLEWLKTD